MARSLSDELEHYRTTLQHICDALNRQRVSPGDRSKLANDVLMIHDALGHTMAAFQAEHVFPSETPIEPAQRLHRVTHAKWLESMTRDGWTWAAAPDRARQQHPLIKPYEQLTVDEHALVLATLVGPIVDVITAAALTLVPLTALGPGVAPVELTVRDFATRIVEGSGGMNDFEAREGVDWGTTDRIAAAEWAIRCLASPDCAGAEQCLQMLMLVRAEHSLEQEQLVGPLTK